MKTRQAIDSLTEHLRDWHDDSPSVQAAVLILAEAIADDLDMLRGMIEQAQR